MCRYSARLVVQIFSIFEDGEGKQEGCVADLKQWEYTWLRREMITLAVARASGQSLLREVEMSFLPHDSFQKDCV